MSTDGPYVVNLSYEFHPDNVNVKDCGHTTSEPHECVHDWRVTWGNLDRTVEG